MRDGAEVLGWGFALASWSSEREAAEARAEFHADGRLRIVCATQDIGTGTGTVIAQVAAEVAQLPLEQIDVAIGRSDFPEGPISGGSMATATVTPAVIDATKQAMEKLIATAARKSGPFAGLAREALDYRDGAVISKEDGRRAGIAEIVKAARLASVDGEARTKPGEEREKYTFREFGAHAVEVRWDPGIAKLRVAHMVCAFDVGRVINQKTAKNQIYGSLLMGLGMALLERSIYDARTGRVVSDNLADYLVAVHADVPEMDVTFLDIPDEHMGGFGTRGIGEIGITGVGGAIVNAVYHATGKRLRELPITIEQLLA
jgi:xanthine dehydrogenase YagR molybdenum-binding subunit